MVDRGPEQVELGSRSELQSTWPRSWQALWVRGKRCSGGLAPSQWGSHHSGPQGSGTRPCNLQQGAARLSVGSVCRLAQVGVEHLTTGQHLTVQPELSTVSWMLSNQSTHKIGWTQQHTRTEVLHPGLNRRGPGGRRKLRGQATQNPLSPTCCNFDGKWTCASIVATH